MRRIEFEKYLGKRVKISLFDGEIISGFLHKTMEKGYEKDPNLRYSPNYYFVAESEGIAPPSSCLFRVSHVRKISAL